MNTMDELLRTHQRAMLENLMREVPGSSARYRAPDGFDFSQRDFSAELARAFDADQAAERARQLAWARETGLCPGSVGHQHTWRHVRTMPHAQGFFIVAECRRCDYHAGRVTPMPSPTVEVPHG